MTNLISELHHSVGVPVEELIMQLNERCAALKNDRPEFALEDINQWLQDYSLVPEVVIQVAAMWLMQFWMDERDGCSAQELLAVDNKYSRMLHNFSMADILAMRQQLIQAADL